MTDQSMRDDFEAWRRQSTRMADKDAAVARHGFGEDARYVNQTTRDQWPAWQAATRQALERAAKVCDERNAFCRQRAQELPQGAELRYMEVCAMLEAGKCADSIRALEG